MSPYLELLHAYCFLNDLDLLMGNYDDYCYQSAKTCSLSISISELRVLGLPILSSGFRYLWSLALNVTAQGCSPASRASNSPHLSATLQQLEAWAFPQPQLSAVSPLAQSQLFTALCPLQSVESQILSVSSLQYLQSPSQSQLSLDSAPRYSLELFSHLLATAACDQSWHPWELSAFHVTSSVH
jgi:hypothetical protein